MSLRALIQLGTPALYLTLVPAVAAGQGTAVSPILPAVVPATPHGPLLSGGSAAVAGMLLAGALLSDQEVREEALEHRGTTSASLARIGNAFGDGKLIVPVIAASYLAAKVTESDEVADVAVRAGVAVGLAAGLTTGLKYGIGRLRPDASSRNLRFHPFGGASAFPSGHTAAAFALATVAAQNVGDERLDILFYGAATLTALARINANRHWASDVIAGAIVGHLSARWVSRALGPIGPMGEGVGVTVPF